VICDVKLDIFDDVVIRDLPPDDDDDEGRGTNGLNIDDVIYGRPMIHIE